MDDNKKTLENEASLIKSEIVKHLPFTVFKNGDWGMFKSISNTSEFINSSVLERILLINIK